MQSSEFTSLHDLAYLLYDLGVGCTLGLQIQVLRLDAVHVLVQVYELIVDHVQTQVQRLVGDEETLCHKTVL